MKDLATKLTESVDTTSGTNLTKDEQQLIFLTMLALFGVTFIAGFRLSRFISARQLDKFINGAIKATEKGQAVYLYDTKRNRVCVAAIKQLVK